MRSVQYGSKWIHYSTQVKQVLKSHYISVEKHRGVILHGSPLPTKSADQIVLKKARWILHKLEVVKAIDEDVIVTGSRLAYLGKSYYVQVIVDPLVEKVLIEFNHSKFKISIVNKSVSQSEIKVALEAFFKVKAAEKITPRLNKLANDTKLTPSNVSIRKMSKRWGSCTADNKIILNSEAVKLPYTLIDYLIVHELCHIRVKDHSKAFWAELSKHIPNWRTLDERINEIKL